MTNQPTKTLTAAALANIEAGAVSGPGTNTCRKCNQPKEATRINSSQCRACGSKNAPPPDLLRIYPHDMRNLIIAQAGLRSMTVEDYLINSMRRVLKRDTAPQG